MAAALKERFLHIPRAYDAFQALVGATGSKRRFVAEHVRARPGDRVLDLGCGTGALRALLPPDVEYVGVEIDPAYVETARARFGSRGTFVCADLTRHVPEQPFELVIAYGVMHHLDDQALRCAYDVAASALAPGGRVLLAEPCRVAGQGRLETTIMNRDRGRHIRSIDGYADPLRKRFPAVETELMPGSYRFPYTMIVLEARH